MIYLASPYTHPVAAVQELRYLGALSYASQLIAQGHPVFSPIVYGHQFLIQHKLPGDFEFWRRFNETMMQTAEEIHVLCLVGWETSKGVSHEIQFASRHGIPLRYITQ